MFAQELITTIFLVIEVQELLFETGNRVTGIAGFFKLAQVDILVAVDARHAQRFIDHCFRGGFGIMTFIAGDFFMFPQQWVAA